MPAHVSTGDRDAVLRQIRWCAAVYVYGMLRYGPLRRGLGGSKRRRRVIG